MTKTGIGTGESAPRAARTDSSETIAASARPNGRGLLDRLEFDAELMDEESINVGPLRDELVKRVPHAVPGRLARAKEDRVARRVRRLEAGAGTGGKRRRGKRG